MTSFSGIIVAHSSFEPQLGLFRVRLRGLTNVAGEPLPVERNASVRDDGRYRLDIDEAIRSDPAAAIAVIGPRGELLGGALLSGLIQADGTLADIRIAGEATARRDAVETAAPRSGRVTIRVFLAAGGVATGTPAADIGVQMLAATVDGEPEPLASGTTDRVGYVSLEVPARPDRTLIARTINAGTAHDTPVANDGAGLPPARLILTIDQAPAAPDAAAADCHCDLVPPRLPDAGELAENGTAFSADLGTGCADFTVPNRTLEEFDFFKIVRTTDPEIMGTSLPDTVAPDRFFQPLLQTIFDSGTLSEQFVAARTEPDDSPALRDSAALMRSLRANPAAAAAAGLDGLAAVRPTLGDELPNYRRTDPLTAQGTAEAARWRVASDDAAAQKGLQAALGKIPVTAIRAALEDPDGFTPVNLMTLERRAVVDAFRKYLGNRSKSVSGRAELNQDNPADWDADHEFYQATTIAHGHLLHYKQEWKADGYSLGELVKSIPLAPGQIKQVAILDWDREDRASRTESVTASESLEAFSSRDRDINEIADAAFSERIRGGSRATTGAVGGGIGFAVGPLVLGGGGGSAWSSSSAWTTGSRELSGQTLNQLRESTAQGVSAVRNQRATVVESVGQSERVTATTEVIANHNRCHALTIQYFEVLRHFAVAERLAGVTECLFVPLQMTAFTDQKVLRWRDNLRNACRRRGLLVGFDAIQRLSSPATTPPDRAYADDAVEELSGRLFIRLSIARPKDPDDASRAVLEQTEWRFLGFVLHVQPEVVYARYRRNEAERDRIFRTEIAPEVARNFLESLTVHLIDRDGNRHDAGLDLALLSKYSEGGLVEIALNEAGNTPRLARRDIAAVEISTDHDLPAFSSVVVERASLTYRTERLTHSLYASDRVFDDVLAGDPATLSTTALSRLEQRNLLKEDRTSRRRLLRHLNDNLEYYHRCLWWMMDANRRFMLLDGIEAPNSGGRSVASVVENRLIGIVGNALVMPVSPGFQLDPALGAVLKPREDPLEALALLYDTNPSPPRRHSVPTRGVFAEAMTGKCNSCETIEDDRFWRWKEFPLPDAPPPIAELSTDSRFAAQGSLAPTPFPDALIKYQTFADAPNPTAMGAALGLLAKDVFKDLTGLTENQKNAMASLTAAMGASESFAGEAFKLSLAQEASRNLDRTVDQIGEAKKAGLLTEEQASKATRDALLRSLGEDATPAKDVTEMPGVSEALDQLGKAPTGSASISRSNGENSETVEVTKDAVGPLTIGTPATEMTRPYPDKILVKTPITLDALLAGGATYNKIFSTRNAEDLRFHLYAREIVNSKLAVIDVLQSLVKKKLFEINGGNVDTVAQIRIGYPADPADTSKIAPPDVAGTRYPLVVLLHGNAASYSRSGIAAPTGKKVGGVDVFTQDIDSQPNHDGYDYLQRWLAQAGRRMVSISIETNLANFLGSLVEMRAQLVLDILTALQAESLKSSSILHDRVDFKTIGLMGHSRGGEAVVLAETMNRVSKAFGIKAVCSLAPTDGLGGTANRLAIAAGPPDVPYFVLYGGLDLDISAARQAGQRDVGGSGFRLYDRAGGSKAMAFVPRCCHTRFNQVWTTVGGGREDRTPIPAASPSEAIHQAIAKEYIGGFFDLTLNRDLGLRPLFNNTLANSAGIPAAIQWRFATRIDVLDALSSAVNPQRTMPAGASIEEFAPLDVPAAAVIGRRDHHVPHMTRAMVIPTGGVGAPTASLRLQLPSGAAATRDLSGVDAISFRLGMLYPVADQTAIDTPGLLPNVSVTLIDDAGTRATLASAAMLAALSHGWVRPQFKLDDGTNATVMFLQTMTFDIAKAIATVAAPTVFHRGTVATLEIVFDLAGGAGGAEIWMNDILLVTR